MTSGALFIDRDGTLVEPRHYPRRPDELVLEPGTAQELAAMRACGIPVILVTNQSGIGRGYMTVAEVAAMHEHLVRMLAAEGASLDAIYVCPHAPGRDDRPMCACRKPMPEMFLRAAAELGLDLASSWMVGDILDDVEAAHRAGCRAVLVDVGTESLPASDPLRTPEHVAPSTQDALRFVRSAMVELAGVA
jgi:D-glycero-D-manno-heptose 1,7-bisphosphate phosphatase